MKAGTCFFICTPLLLFALAGASRGDVVEDYILGTGAAAARSPEVLVRFPERLSKTQFAACLDFLSKNVEGDSARYDIVRQNDLADWLIKKPDYAEETIRKILSVVEDDSQNLLWREYCLQKIPLAWSQPGIDSSLRQECLAVMTRYMKDPRASFAGTSLLGLYRLISSGRITSQTIDSETVKDAAYQVFSSRTGTPANRIAALHVGAGLDDRRVVAEGLQIVRNSDSANPHLLSAAISATRDYFDPEDVALMQTLLKHPDYRVRSAARATIDDLKQK